MELKTHVRAWLMCICWAALCSAHIQPTLAESVNIKLSVEDPQFSKKFHPIDVSDFLKPFLDRSRQPTREESAIAYDFYQKMINQDAEIERYLKTLQAHPELTPNIDELVKILSDLLAIGINRLNLYPVAQYWGSFVGTPANDVGSVWSATRAWPMASTLLRSKADNDTAQKFELAIRHLAKELSKEIGDCSPPSSPVLALLGTDDRAGIVPFELRFSFITTRFDAGKSSCRTFHASIVNSLGSEDLERLSRYIGDETRSRATAEMAMAYHEACRQMSADHRLMVLGICPWATGAIGRNPIFDNGEPILHPNDASEFVWHSVKTNNMVPGAEFDAWLKSVTDRLKGDLVERVTTSLDSSPNGAPISGYWINSTKSVLVFALSGANAEYGTGVGIILVDKSGYRTIESLTTYGQYNDDVIESITDQDGDGHPEIWIKATLGECDGEDGEQEVGVDCSVEGFHRLEVFGSDLIPYIEGPRPSKAAPRDRKPGRVPEQKT